jgi:hypothetical protein
LERRTPRMVYFKGKNDAIPPTTKEYIGNNKDTMLRNKDMVQVNV